jgi:hypothetical protein
VVWVVAPRTSAAAATIAVRVMPGSHRHDRRANAAANPDGRCRPQLFSGGVVVVDAAIRHTLVGLRVSHRTCPSQGGWGIVWLPPPAPPPSQQTVPVVRLELEGPPHAAAPAPAPAR